MQHAAADRRQPPWLPVVALPLSRSTGGWESPTMLAVMFNGIGGVVVSQAVWLFARSSDAEDRAFSLGTTSHAMGIARTLTASPDAVAFASCGMLLARW
ncbi:LrgB family protein (plasmid) [Sinorhizobium sp. BG8]|nr:LrgB family protein [Sinorhizobium sp. BG8]